MEIVKYLMMKMTEFGDDAVQCTGVRYSIRYATDCKLQTCISDNVELGLESRIVSHLSSVSTLEYLLEVRTKI